MISRKMAKQEGLKRYSTGKPCLRGHVCERFVSTKVCVECSANASKLLRKENRSLAEVSSKKWKAANPQAVAAAKRAWYLGNTEKHSAARSKWEAENPGSKQARCVKRRLSKKNRTPPWANASIIGAIYSLAKIYRECGFEVEVDHIIPLQGKLVSGLHVHENLEIIPSTVNKAKHNSFVVI